MDTGPARAGCPQTVEIVDASACRGSSRGAAPRRPRRSQERVRPRRATWDHRLRGERRGAGAAPAPITWLALRLTGSAARPGPRASQPHPAEHPLVRTREEPHGTGRGLRGRLVESVSQDVQDVDGLAGNICLGETDAEVDDPGQDPRTTGAEPFPEAVPTVSGGRGDLTSEIHLGRWRPASSRSGSPVGSGLMSRRWQVVCPSRDGPERITPCQPRGFANPLRA